ncbi:unnamed protein product [Ambrosiozyma monospora]|uniref:Unnamed protein product n=1 Tax=Ambrosiozyma monospora TaxID=43982 RepID=A0A9W6Z032_AMBMO|nr:unnamed protein product [Ambrosiozyma monospora]
MAPSSTILRHRFFSKITYHSDLSGLRPHNRRFKYKYSFTADRYEFMFIQMDKIAKRRTKKDHKEIYFPEYQNKDMFYWLEQAKPVYNHPRARLFINPDVHLIDAGIFMDIVTAIKTFALRVFIRTLFKSFSPCYDFCDLHAFMNSVCSDLHPPNSEPIVRSSVSNETYKLYLSLLKPLLGQVEVFNTNYALNIVFQDFAVYLFSHYEKLAKKRYDTEDSEHLFEFMSDMVAFVSNRFIRMLEDGYLSDHIRRIEYILTLRKNQ